MHLYVVIAALLLSAMAPFMDNYRTGEADYTQQDDPDQPEATETDSEKL